MKEFIGKTIKSITKYGAKGYDDVPIIKIEFSDGSKMSIEATYGGYTGNSLDEYPSFIRGTEDNKDIELYIVEQII